MYLVQVYKPSDNQGTKGLPNPGFVIWFTVNQTTQADVAKEELQTYSLYYKKVRVMQTQDAKDVTSDL
jgi:hypothetical protein